MKNEAHGQKEERQKVMMEMALASSDACYAERRGRRPWHRLRCACARCPAWVLGLDHTVLRKAQETGLPLPQIHCFQRAKPSVAPSGS